MFAMPVAIAYPSDGYLSWYLGMKASGCMQRLCAPARHEFGTIHLNGTV